MNNLPEDIHADRIDTSIQSLKQYLDEEDLAHLISVLEAIKQSPQDDALLAQLSEVFAGLGILQGAVLTYAPYITDLVSDNLFDDPDQDVEP
jgi:hypothetical protein